MTLLNNIDESDFPAILDALEAVVRNLDAFEGAELAVVVWFVWATLGFIRLNLPRNRLGVLGAKPGSPRVAHPGSHAAPSVPLGRRPRRVA